MPYSVLDPATAIAAPAFTKADPTTGTAAMDRSVLVTEIQRECGNRTELTAAIVQQRLNWAYDELASMLDVPELEASYTQAFTSGNPLYKLPAGTRYVNNVFVADSAEFSVTKGREFTQIDLEIGRASCRE